MQKVWAADTVAGGRVADVNTVHPHVDVILHVPPLLIIVEHKSPVTPKVKPVFFPSSQYGALKNFFILGWIQFMYAGLQLLQYVL